MTDIEPRPLTELEQQLFDEHTVVDIGGVSFRVANQSFKVGPRVEDTEHQQWYRRMLAIALARLVEKYRPKTVTVIEAGNCDDRRVEAVSIDPAVTAGILEACDDSGRATEWEISTTVPRYYRYCARMPLEPVDGTRQWGSYDIRGDDPVMITEVAVFELRSWRDVEETGRVAKMGAIYRSSGTYLFYIEGLGEDSEEAIKNAADYKAEVLAGRPHPSDAWIQEQMER